MFFTWTAELTSIPFFFLVWSSKLIFKKTEYRRLYSIRRIDVHGLWIGKCLLCVERYDIVSRLREKKKRSFRFFMQCSSGAGVSPFSFLVTMKLQPAHSCLPLHVPDGCRWLNLGPWEFLRVTLCIQFLGYCGRDIQPPGYPLSEGSGFTSAWRVRVCLRGAALASGASQRLWRGFSAVTGALGGLDCSVSHFQLSRT